MNRNKILLIFTFIMLPCVNLYANNLLNVDSLKLTFNKESSEGKSRILSSVVDLFLSDSKDDNVAFQCMDFLIFSSKDVFKRYKQNEIHKLFIYISKCDQESDLVVKTNLVILILSYDHFDKGFNKLLLSEVEIFKIKEFLSNYIYNSYKEKSIVDYINCLLVIQQKIIETDHLYYFLQK